MTTPPPTSTSPAGPALAAPALLACPVDVHAQVTARTTRPDFHRWLVHVRPAAACARPIRLTGDMVTVRRTGPDSAEIVGHRHTESMPDGVIYKACGTRLASVCPSCSKRYQRDAYQIVKTLLVGGKGVPETVAGHPEVFATFTAPSFGPVHSRWVKRHTCRGRDRCTCRPEPCHARRHLPRCPHGRALFCFARHEETDKILGAPLCPDCYDYPAHVVWNASTRELWRRTTIAMTRYLQRTARARRIDPATIKLTFGKVAETQRRAAMHFHVPIRLDGHDPHDKDAILPPPAGIGLADLIAAIRHAAAQTTFTTGPHPINDHGWRITWGEQVDVATINTGTDDAMTDGQVAGYTSKYATKSTEITGHTSGRITPDTIDSYADPAGTHTQRLIAACWHLGGPAAWRRLRLWAHRFGFGGHFLTKSRRHRVTFGLLHAGRIIHRRTPATTTGPDTTDGQPPEQDTTLVVNFLQFAGAGWHTTGDALLANASAAMAREHPCAVLEAVTAMTA